MNETRLAAFVEWVVRPLTEDWRIILEELRKLNIGLTQKTVRDICLSLGIWHLLGEIIRAISYIAITWLICQTIIKIL